MKEDVENNSIPATIGYGIVITTGATAIAAALLYSIPAIWNDVFDQLLFTTIAFIIYGTIHVVLGNKEKFAAFTASSTYGVQNTAILTLAILCSIGIQYNLLARGSLLVAFISAAAFYLPFISVAAYRHFQYIPDPQYNLWFSQKNLISNRSIVFLSTLPLKIKVAPTLLHKYSSVYPCIVPAQMDVGTLFQYFLAHQQYKKIDIENEDEIGNPVGWVFYEEKWQGHKIRPLNPDLNLRDNKVEANAVVVAKRIIINPDTVPLLSAKHRNHELHKQ
jgi:hypothetical protein